MTPTRPMVRLWIAALAALAALLAPAASRAQVAVKAKTVHTAAGAPIEDGMVIFRDGKIAAVGKASDHSTVNPVAALAITKSGT